MKLVSKDEEKKQMMIKSLLGQGIYKKNNKQLYMLSLSELEDIYTEQAGQNKNDTWRNGVETMERAVFAAGCFWGVEALFQQLNGVTSTSVGFTGGKTIDPSYEEVYKELTGHAEAVLVEYNPAIISYDELLQVFFENHNPTSLNRQGEDVGTRYRSAIFYSSEEQRTLAEKAKIDLTTSGKFKKPIVTQIVPATNFYRAEEYHQSYLAKRGQSSCKIS
ncbi:peptide-methionine (S)-S-oxide reductase MsrA [Guptibacillus algicola]|uniref:peptide-methionine (S)-S-oxide reductase MsrA n=1 Tax=Guptibacillus algicola TaxID=225844 RepID=UPI001CD1E914|nr:peptide-methionine (S)-S-oxide reductase MsrA [Alkalihalobacillus algicola]MCA0988258.1 peptide-methionine (S)-S-oxide reductase MsrA [Alkalihalobacillus algicola]